MALVSLAFYMLVVLAGASRGADEPTDVVGNGPSMLASQEIPARYLALYMAAAARYRIDWAVLAAIGRVECDHGRDPDPACTREGAVNAAGAGGPMQFLASTWSRFGVDGDDDGRVDRWDPADAIYAAARYLRAMGAPRRTVAAIFAYNHANWYVAEVQRWAARYRATTPASPALETSAPSLASPTRIVTVAGERARLLPGDGHLAMVPSGVPAVVQAMVVAGNELQDLHYGPGGHPDPLGVSEEDCSSTVNYVLYRAAVRPLSEILADNPLAQDYVHWGDSGPGRWVTIYATDLPTPHVFITIAGLRLDTSHDGTDVGPNRAQDGPRWRILGHIPTWAHWAVRHPPGL
jgi:Transglycosylase SLT domain